MPSNFNSPVAGSASYFLRLSLTEGEQTRWYQQRTSGAETYSVLQRAIFGQARAAGAITADDLRTVARSIRATPGTTVSDAERESMAAALDESAASGRMTPRALAILLYLAERRVGGAGRAQMTPSDVGVPENVILPSLGAAPPPQESSGSPFPIIPVEPTETLVTASRVVVMPIERVGDGGSSRPNEGDSMWSKALPWLIGGAAALVVVAVIVGAVLASRSTPPALERSSR